MASLKDICSGLPLDPLPFKQEQRDTSVPHAPVRTPSLSPCEEKVIINYPLYIIIYFSHPAK